MGVVSPQPNNIGSDCLPCWSAGNTPKVIYVAFWGIQKGSSWIPVYGSPINGLYAAYNVGGCRFQNITDNLYVDVQLSSGGFSHVFGGINGWLSFDSVSEVQCSPRFAGGDLFGRFTGGSATVLSANVGGGTGLSFQELKDLLVIPYDVKFFGEIVGGDLQSTRFRFCRTCDKSNVKVKFN